MAQAPQRAINRIRSQILAMINRLPYQIQGPVRAAYAPVMRGSDMFTGMLNTLPRINTEDMSDMDEEQMGEGSSFRSSRYRPYMAMFTSGVEESRCARMLRTVMALQNRLSEVMAMLNSQGYTIVMNRPGMSGMPDSGMSQSPALGPMNRPNPGFGPNQNGFGNGMPPGPQNGFSLSNQPGNGFGTPGNSNGFGNGMSPNGQNGFGGSNGMGNQGIPDQNGMGPASSPGNMQGSPSQNGFGPSNNGFGQRPSSMRPIRDQNNNNGFGPSSSSGSQQPGGLSGSNDSNNGSSLGVGSSSMGVQAGMSTSSLRGRRKREAVTEQTTTPVEQSPPHAAGGEVKPKNTTSQS